ncbi:alpha/beta-hydrolase [Thozetella sp. PMI_491]|nr:alpha/beta-hydrolase [Thozetella sp. PMI_491]
MNSACQPVILLVPGAFGTPASFDQLLPYLTEAGFSTFPASYPSCNPSNAATVSCLNDIVSIREKALLPLLDQEGKNVIILAHSYGGVVAGAAAKNLDLQTRKSQGKPVGVIGLVYIAGNITLDGESLLEAVGGAYPSFIKINKPSHGLALIEPATDILYNDCDPILALKFASTALPHALLAFETKPTAPAWADKGFDGRRAYIRTLKDCCNPVSLQDTWLEKSKVVWNIFDFDTGHMPFASQPEALAAKIVEFINGLLKL